MSGMATIGIAVFAPQDIRAKGWIAIVGLASLYGWSIFFDADSARTQAFFDMPQDRLIDTIANGVMVIVLLVLGVSIVRKIIPRLPKPSVEKERPDLLKASDTQDEVSSMLGDSGGVFAGELEGRALYTSIQDRAVVLGPPGTGKTVFLVSQLLEWTKSGRSFVVLDNKPEIQKITQAALEKKGYRVVVFNPTSNTGSRYNLLDDVHTPEAIGELAATLIPSESAEDAVFNESARDFLDALITHCRAQGQGSLPGLQMTLRNTSACSPPYFLQQAS